MAKRKLNLKGAARRVGAGARKAAGKLDPMAILKANAGGFAAALAVDKLDDMEAVQGMGPFAAPAIVEAGGIVLAMMGGKELEPVAYGLMGGAAALAYAPIMDQIEGDGDGAPANGTNTINAVDTRVKKLMRGVLQRAAVRPSLQAVPVARRGESNAINRMGGDYATPVRVDRWERKYSSQADC